MPANGGVGQNGDYVWLHFQHAASDENELFLATACRLDPNFAGFDTRDQGGVPGKNPKFARFAGEHDKLGLAGIDLFLGAYDINVQGVGHGLAPVKGEG